MSSWKFPTGREWKLKYRQCPGEEETKKDCINLGRKNGLLKNTKLETWVLCKMVHGFCGTLICFFFVGVNSLHRICIYSSIKPMSLNWILFVALFVKYSCKHSLISSLTHYINSELFVLFKNKYFQFWKPVKSGKMCLY